MPTQVEAKRMVKYIHKITVLIHSENAMNPFELKTISKEPIKLHTSDCVLMLPRVRDVTYVLDAANVSVVITAVAVTGYFVLDIRIFLFSLDLAKVHMYIDQNIIYCIPSWVEE